MALIDETRLRGQRATMTKVNSDPFHSNSAPWLQSRVGLDFGRLNARCRNERAPIGLDRIESDRIGSIDGSFLGPHSTTRPIELSASTDDE